MADADDGDGPPPDDDPAAEQPSGSGDREVAATAEELAEVLSELRAELREGRRGPFGLPAPPRPGEVLRFTDEHAIPFAIAVLEANIRALELLQGAIRLVESGQRTGEEARATRDRAASLSRATLDRLDDALADLETAATGRELPPDESARSIVEEARRLRAELSDALDGEGTGGATDADDPDDADNGGAAPGVDPLDDAGGATDEAGDGAASTGGADDVPVDVEGELQSIKEDLGKVDDGTGEGDPADGAGNSTADGTQETADDSSADGTAEAADGSSGDGTEEAADGSDEDGTRSD
jgi:hypothetical protein